MANVSRPPLRRLLNSREILEARRRQEEICRRKDQLLNETISIFKEACLTKVRPRIGVRAAMRQPMDTSNIQPAQGLLQKQRKQLSIASGSATPAAQELAPSFRRYSPLDISGFFGDLRELYDSYSRSAIFNSPARSIESSSSSSFSSVLKQGSSSLSLSSTPSSSSKLDLTLVMSSSVTQDSTSTHNRQQGKLLKQQAPKAPSSAA